MACPRMLDETLEESTCLRSTTAHNIKNHDEVAEEAAEGATRTQSLCRLLLPVT